MMGPVAPLPGKGLHSASAVTPGGSTAPPTAPTGLAETISDGGKAFLSKFRFSWVPASNLWVNLMT